MLIMILIVRRAREICFDQSEALFSPGLWHIIGKEFLQSFLRRHFAGGQHFLTSVERPLLIRVKHFLY